MFFKEFFFLSQSYFQSDLVYYVWVALFTFLGYLEYMMFLSLSNYTFLLNTHTHSYNILFFLYIISEF